VNADVATSGASLGALRSNLAGTAALQLRDGAIKGLNLARAMRQAKAALSLKQDAVARARVTEQTDFSELTASARIAGGVAQSDDLDVKSPFLRIGGAGRLDIGRGTIDYTARATVVAAPAGQDAGDLAALRGVTVPVQLTGPFEAIDWHIQWSGVAAAAIESRLKERLADKLGGALGAKLGATPPPAGAASAPVKPVKPEDRLKEKLKGLFK
jgi:AsmA protein